MKRLFFSIVSLIFAATMVTAKENNQSPSTASAKPLMDQFLVHMTALKEFMTSDEKFNDPKNASEIQKHLEFVSEIANKINHDKNLHTPGFRPSAEVLRKHVAETAKAFSRGNKNYARWMLNSTLSICMSCHSQTSSSSRQLWPQKLTDTYTSAFDQAEFLFTIRNFDKSHELYEKAIKGYPTNKLQTEKLETALQREVAYYSRINHDALGGIKILTEYKNLPAMPGYLKENIEAWIGQFKNWQKEEIFDLKNPNADAIKIFIKKHLSDEDDPDAAGSGSHVVNDLYSSGVLFEYLQKNPKSELTPEILYWLAVCDRGVNSNFFYSLADIYLTDCMTKYPKSPFAKKCYKEYEENTIAAYTGSSGTHLTDDVKSELKRLRKMVDYPTNEKTK